MLSSVRQPPILAQKTILLIALVLVNSGCGGSSAIDPAGPISNAPNELAGSNNEAPVNNEKPVIVVKPTSIDTLKGDFEATCRAYFKQQFPDSINVDATVEFCSQIDRDNQEAKQLKEELDRLRPGELDYKAKAVYWINSVNKLKFAGKSDPFLLREAYKFSACRLFVAKQRFAQTKAALNRANTPEEMKARTETVKSDEIFMNRFESTKTILGNRMAEENLDTTAIQKTAGLD